MPTFGEYQAATLGDAQSPTIGGNLVGGNSYSAHMAEHVAMGVATRTAPLRVATFGDSTGSAGNIQNTPQSTQHDTSRLIASAWNSGTVSFTMAPDRYNLYMFYPQAYLCGSGGISGQTTTQMVARDTAAAASNRFATSDIIDLNPNVVLLRGGSINDLLGITAATYSATVNTAYANHVLLLQRFMSAGIAVIDSGLFGYSGSNNTDLTRAAIVELNTRYANYAAEFPRRIFSICDRWEGLLSLNGAYLPYVSVDGTHLSSYGQYLVGQQEALVLSGIFGPSAQHRYPGANRFANPMFANTGSVGYGTQAAGVTITSTNATRQNAKIETINGKLFQTCEFVASAGGNLAQIALAFDPSGTGALNISAGDLWGFEADFYVSGIGGYALTPNSQGFVVDIRNTVGAGRVVYNQLGVSTATPFPPGFVWAGHVVWAPIQMGDSSANFTTASNWTMTFGTNDATAKYKIGVANPRIVKLGANVITT